jgi:alanine-glyoxylate transaminase/serine-glyoxylate transaminase/serine-pyruvate transaminase
MCLGAISGAEMAMHDAGVDLALGSGVAAAQRWYAAPGAARVPERRVA